jgi:hypothetical protein
LGSAKIEKKPKFKELWPKHLYGYDGPLPYGNFFILEYGYRNKILKLTALRIVINTRKFFET